MSKKIIACILVVILLLANSLIAGAAQVQTDLVEKIPVKETVQPMYKYTATTLASLSISNNTAQCFSQIIGYQNVTKISITMTLEKKTLFWWSDVETWTATYYSPTAQITKSYSVKSGKYRVKVKFVVYAGSNSETITTYSSQEEC